MLRHMYSTLPGVKIVCNWKSVLYLYFLSLSLSLSLFHTLLHNTPTGANKLSTELAYVQTDHNAHMPQQCGFPIDLLINFHKCYVFVYWQERSGDVIARLHVYWHKTNVLIPHQSLLLLMLKVIFLQRPINTSTGTRWRYTKRRDDKVASFECKGKMQNQQNWKVFCNLDPIKLPYLNLLLEKVHEFLAGDFFMDGRPAVLYNRFQHLDKQNRKCTEA